jgi:hypothetical protein
MSNKHLARNRMVGDVGNPHASPAAVYMTVADARRFQRIRQQSVYIKDQPSWPISVSNCIYETYDLGKLLASDPLKLDALQLIVVAFPPCALLCVAVLRAKSRFSAAVSESNQPCPCSSLFTRFVRVTSSQLQWNGPICDPLASVWPVTDN